MAEGRDDLEARLAALHTTAPGAFRAARDALARDLAAAGDRRAAQVRALPRPTLAVWAIDLAAQHAPAAVGALLDAATAVLRANAAALGGGPGGAMVAANHALDAALDRAVGACAEAVAAAGRPLGRAARARARATLRALALGGEDERRRLREGRVTEEASATGLEALGALRPIRAPAHPSAARAVARAQRATPERDTERDAARARERARAAREAARAEQEVRAAEARARALRAEADAAQRRADAAADLWRDADRALREARARLDEVKRGAREPR